LGIAGIGIILNYLVLSGYDWLALDYIGRKLPYKKVLKAAGISFAFSNTKQSNDFSQSLLHHNFTLLLK
ncbi:MAG: hypothetical protein II567_04330, partial [Candidatus Riflebacteria bacterium]|nr:hypothetical protein [Candidatus Riflebacteria bacterium]